MLMANAASVLAAKTPGKDSLAIEAYAKALRQVIVAFMSGNYNGYKVTVKKSCIKCTLISM